MTISSGRADFKLRVTPFIKSTIPSFLSLSTETPSIFIFEFSAFEITFLGSSISLPFKGVTITVFEKMLDPSLQ